MLLLTIMVSISIFYLRDTPPPPRIKPLNMSRLKLLIIIQCCVFCNSMNTLLNNYQEFLLSHLYSNEPNKQVICAFDSIDVMCSRLSAVSSLTMKLSSATITEWEILYLLFILHISLSGKHYLETVMWIKFEICSVLAD